MKRILLLALTVLSTSVIAQTLNPASLEQLVNTDVAATQYCPVIAADDQNNYMVFWTMSYYAGEIKARRYNSSHQAISDEISINADNSKLMVAHYWEDGKYVLSYIENSNNTLKFVIINPDNSLEAEVTVLANVEGFDVNINGDTLAYVYNNIANNSQIQLRGYNLNNNAWIGSQVLVTESASVDYSEPNIVIHPNGRMTVVYHQYILVSGCCTYNKNILRKTFSSSFLAEIPEQALWTVNLEQNVGSDLDAEGNEAGEVLIATTHGTTSSFRVMRIWIVSATGSLIVNNSSILSGGSNDWYDNIECHLYDNGDFLITKSIRTGGWTNPNGNEAYVISGNNYNASNSGLLQLNATNAGDQEYVALAILPNGGFVTAWAGNGFQGDTQGIYARAYNAVAFPGLFAGTASYQVNEGGATTAIPIVLNTQPTGNVTVSIQSTNTSEVTVSPSTLTFTSSNWSTPQFVNAQGVNDSADDGNIGVTITLSTSTSADATYAGLAASTVSVTNLDNDATITAPGDQEICQNTGLSGVNAIITNNGGSINTVTASSSNTSVIDNSDIAIVNLGGGQYSFSISNLNNNTAGTSTITIQAQDENFTYTDQFDVEVDGINVTLNTGDLSICEGEQVTLAASGASTLSWNNGVQNNVSFIPSQTATYTVTASNGGACSSSASVTITVNETAQTPNITASSTQVCAGESVTLSATGATNITWNNGVVNGAAFVPTETETYVVIADNGNDCTSTNSIQIVVNPLPNAPQILATDQEICSGEGVSLLALGNNTLTWDNGVENNVEFFPTTTTTYTVTGNNGTECSSTASIEIIVNPSPVTPTITLFNGALVSSAITGNQWYFNGNLIEGATNQILQFTELGNYTVVVTSNGCTSTSEVFEVEVSVEELLRSAMVFPNPASEVINIQGLMPGAQFNLFDSRGQLVRTSIITTENTIVDISDLANGVYMASFVYHNMTHHIKIIKQ
ncbi:MAG: T9SS type A sorting domain-containing protein [Flavobacteriales bacterium]|jgi:hypothetical protein